MRSVTHIVPSLPPALDAVGQYALLLDSELSKRWGIHSKYLIPGGVISDTRGSNQDCSVFERTANGLADSLKGTELAILHYVGYGFAEKGCPTWLAAGLESWRQAGGRRRLVTVFHELYAGGPIWSTAFWLRPMQKQIVRRLARISDGVQLSGEVPERLLRALIGPTQRATNVLPMISCVGESPDLAPLSSRTRNAVVFGTPGRRSAVYQRSGTVIALLRERLNIAELLDIGEPLADYSSAPADLIRVGSANSDLVREALKRSIIGLIDYRTELLSKSAIFASYCAHGLASVVLEQDSTEPHDGLERGVHFLTEQDFRAAPIHPERLQSVADAAHDWYQNHNLSMHAKRIAECFRE